MTYEDFKNDRNVNIIPQQPDTKNIIGKVLNFVNKNEKYEVIDFSFHTDCECTSDCDCEDIFGTQFHCICLESPASFMIGMEFRFDAKEWGERKNNNIQVEDKKLLKER